MNNRFIKLFSIIASSAVFVAGCDSDNSAFENPDASGASANSGTVSQKNLSLLAADTQPTIFDPDTGTATDTIIVITAKIGDRNNQLLTDKHTIFFATEWGLIEPSCETNNGTCTVNWQTSFGPGQTPADLRTTIIAYTLGEEEFNDSNGNGEFDDGDVAFPDGSNELFRDREEPFVDIVRNSSQFEAGDVILDVMSGNDLGSNGAHDTGDGFYNGTKCAHSSLCSSVRKTIFIWDDISLKMDGPPAAP